MFTKIYIIFAKVNGQINNVKGGEAMANRNTRQTSKKVASKASKILTDGRYGKNAKSVAGSALSQTRPSKRK